jgi:hypothetical protein
MDHDENLHTIKLCLDCFGGWVNPAIGSSLEFIDWGQWGQLKHTGIDNN